VNRRRSSLLCLPAVFCDPPVSQPGAVTGRLLDAAGDQMLRALIFHSDRLELSEQFDRTTGFEKSV
jgi:hypothetical protein